MVMMQRVCAVCGGEAFREFLCTREDGALALIECVDCGLGVIDPLPTKETLEQTWTPLYNCYWQQADMVEVHARLLVRLRRRLEQVTYAALAGPPGSTGWLGQVVAKLFGTRLASPPQHVPGGTILDVGCGNGFFLKYMRQAGWAAAGIELSPLAAAHARAAGFQVEIGDFCTGTPFSSGSFDVVRLSHVLEHLRDPAAAIVEAHRLTREDLGLVIVALPNFSSLQRRMWGPSWTGLDLPRHLYHFTPTAVARLLVRQGLVVEQIGFYSAGTAAASLRSAFLALAKRRLDEASSDSLLFRLLTLPVDMLAALLRMGDSMVLYARKVKLSERPPLRRTFVTGTSSLRIRAGKQGFSLARCSMRTFGRSAQ